MPHLRMRNQMFEEIERCCIYPLQIIEKQRERMLRLGEHAEEPPEHQLEAVLGISRRQLWNGRLFPDDDLQLRDEADDQLAVRLDRLRQGTTPPVHLGFALDQNLMRQRLEGLCQGRVRDIARILVELARSEKPTWRNKDLVQFVYHRRLADPGISGHEQEFRRAVGHDTIEGREQGIGLAL